MRATDTSGLLSAQGGELIMSYRNLLKTSALYTVVQGVNQTPVLRDHEWDMFEVDDFCAGPDEIDTAMQLGIEVHRTDDGLLTPMVDDEATRNKQVDDLSACQAYLARGGVLVKLPDKGNPDASRWYPVLRLQGLHARVAAALGWTVEETRSFSLWALRDVVRPVSPKLAHEITCKIGGLS